MNNDLQIIHQVLGREIENLVAATFPQFNMLNPQIKNFIFEKIDPVLLMFTSPNKTIDIDTASAFVQEELANKINDFKSRVEVKRNEGTPNE